jgi:hypothetical protein
MQAGLQLLNTCSTAAPGPNRIDGVAMNSGRGSKQQIQGLGVLTHSKTATATAPIMIPSSSFTEPISCSLAAAYRGASGVDWIAGGHNQNSREGVTTTPGSQKQQDMTPSPRSQGNGEGLSACWLGH